MSNSKGFCILAQNNSSTDYVRQAYALACSIHRFNNNQKVCLITNDIVPEEYVSTFDCIIPVPWTDQADNTEWKIENRWKVYHASPYDETIVMDADMLVLQNIEHWWNYLEKRDLFFTTHITTYRGELALGRDYRKVFDSNDLPDLYSAFYYFKKGDVAKQFFVMLELVMINWEYFYGKFAPVDYQKWCSVDVSCAIAAKLLGITNDITDLYSPISLTHMKPRLQYWHHIPDRWTKVLDCYMNEDFNLMIGNFSQRGILHYVEDEFLTDKILQRIVQ